MASPDRRIRDGLWWSVRRATGPALGEPPRVPDLPVRPPPPPPFTGASGVLMGPADRGIDRHCPLHGSDRVVPDLGFFQQTGPGAVRFPASEPLVDRLPRPIAFREITPRSTGPQTPQHPVDHLPMITPRAPTTVNTRQQGSYPLPRHICQLATTHHKINYQTGPRGVSLFPAARVSVWAVRSGAGVGVGHRGRRRGGIGGQRGPRLGVGAGPPLEGAQGLSGTVRLAQRSQWAGVAGSHGALGAGQSPRPERPTRHSGAPG